MIIREVTVGGLFEFIHSDEYLKLEPKPITSGRAVSQAKNPDARAEDVALVYMVENNKLIAFAGIIPDKIEGSEESVFSNSGWWVDRDLGRKYGLTVFFKAYQSCRRRMFFTDCSEHTKSILEKTGLFAFRKPAVGLRIIFRFYSGELFRKKGINQFATGCFSVADAFLNYIVSFRLDRWQKNNFPQGYSIHPVKKINGELNEFIKKHSSKYLLKQDAEKLNWIIQYPWIVTEKDALLVPYPFSQFAGSFKQEFLVVKNEEETVAVLLFSIRDCHASIPYIYYDGKYLQDVLKVILNHLLNHKINSLVIFQHEVLKGIEKAGIPSIIKLKVNRYLGYSKALDGIFSNEKGFQDGEGDIAFT